MVAKKAKPFASRYFSWHKRCQAGDYMQGFLSYLHLTWVLSLPLSQCCFVAQDPSTPAAEQLLAAFGQICHCWKNPTTKTTPEGPLGTTSSG